MADSTSNYARIAELAAADAEALRVKGASYGDSWKRRGGVGAFMMLARKWDRLELAARVVGWDVFAAAHDGGAYGGLEEGVLDDIRDLRRYLLLVEDEVLRRSSSAPEDTGEPGRAYVDPDRGVIGGGSRTGGPVGGPIGRG